MRDAWTTLGLIVSAIGVLLVWIYARPAHGHDGYEAWTMPDAPGVSCCNNTDFRPTRAYFGEDGLWRAWNGFAWLTVPPNKLLPTDLKHDGRSHLCEINGVVYCFSPSEPKS